MTSESEYLVALARQLAAAYLAHACPQAILLTGSAAVGESDRYSDVDLILYYESLPPEDALEAVRDEMSATEYTEIGPRTGRECAESYRVRGVDCQVAHVTLTAWEEDMAGVLDRMDVASPIQKALDGMLEGVALHGEARVREWQAQAAAYPDALARAMVEHYLRFFPIWYVQDRLASRDATLWERQILVESAQNILGVLAGLNRLYYSTFQFKRMRSFIDKMVIAPPGLYERLERLFEADRSTAIRDLEALCTETVALVREHMPSVPTDGMPRFAGQRARPWVATSSPAQ